MEIVDRSVSPKQHVVEVGGDSGASTGTRQLGARRQGP